MLLVVVWNVVNQIAAPEKNIIVVSVTMNGGMPSRVMQKPLKAPIASPTATMASIAAGTASGDPAR